MSLIAHYRMEGNAEDEFGNPSFSFTNSNYQYSPGKIGQGVELTSSQLYVSNNNGILKPRFSVGMWFNRFTNPSYECEFAINNVMYFRIYSNNFQIRIWTVESGDSGNRTIGGGFSLNTWYHAVVTFDGTDVKCYIDGSYFGGFSHPGKLATNTQPLLLGGRGNVGDYLYSGIIDDTRIYDHVLSEREVRDLSLGLLSYYPLSGDTLDAAYFGNISIGSGSFIEDSDKGKVADITTTQASIPLSDIPLDLKGETISFWENCVLDRSTVGGGGFGHTFIKFGTYYGNNSGGFGFISGSFRYYLRGPDASGWTDQGGSSLANHIYDQGGWIHHTLVFTEDDRIIYYMNSQEVVNIPLSVPYTGLFSNGVDFGQNVQALLSQVKIFKTVLTPDQVKELHQQRASIDSIGNLLANIDESSPYLSPQSSAQTGWPKQNVNYDVTAESDPCSGPLTFQQALDYVNAQGGRLPTREEMAASVTTGTGCSYDFEYCWTCEKGEDDSEHWVSFGNPNDAGAGPDYILSNTSTAVVRFVADDDLNRDDPVTINDSVIREWLYL